MNISILLKDTECLYHGQMQTEPSFNNLLARANHYPGLKTAKLSSAALEKVLVGKLKTFF